MLHYEKSKNFKNKTEIKFMIKISILDYGMGNIESLKNAIKKIGYHPTLFSAKKNINSNFFNHTRCGCIQ